MIYFICNTSAILPLQAINIDRCIDMVTPLKTADAQEVFELSARGLGITLIAKQLGMDVNTLYRIMRDDSSISHAVKKGRESAIERVESSLYNQAVSEKNVISTIFYLKNAKPDQYKDKHEMNHTGGMTVNVGMTEPPLLHNDADNVHNEKVIEHDDDDTT